MNSTSTEQGSNTVSTATPELPPLPAHRHSLNSGMFDPLYTADQMLAFRAAGIAADRAANSLAAPNANLLIEYFGSCSPSGIDMAGGNESNRLQYEHAEMLDRLRATLAAPSAGAGAAESARETAKSQYDKIMDEAASSGDEPMSAIERLRLFCSFAMCGQDWLDVEPFFDDVLAAPLAAGAVDAPNQTVRIPSSEDEAALMVLLGMDWLKQHAPHLLKAGAVDAAPQVEPVVSPRVRDALDYLYPTTGGAGRANSV